MEASENPLTGAESLQRSPQMQAAKQNLSDTFFDLTWVGLGGGPGQLRPAIHGRR